jgi:ribose transport system permease protein
MKNVIVNSDNRKKTPLLGQLMQGQIAMILPTLLILIGVFALINPVFISEANVFSVLKTLAFYGIVAVGETLIILGGDIDISVGSTAGFGAVFSTFLMMRYNCFGMLGSPTEWIGVLLSMIITIIVCSAVGFVNAGLVVHLKLPPFIATIATLYSVRGAIMVVTNGNPIYPLPTFFMDGIGRFEIPLTELGGISLPFILFIFFVILFDFLLRRTTFGRNIYATGSNREVAKLSGINTNKVRYMNFVITSMLAGLSGILVAAFTRQGYPPIGQGWELQIIAATAIGGISLTGGSGSVIGTLIGILIMGVLNNGLVILGINTFAQSMVIGGVILIAVYVDILRLNRKVRS